MERRGDEYCVVISQEELAALRLTEEKPVKATSVEVRYITVAEALAAYDSTEPQHRNSYRELAK